MTVNYQTGGVSIITWNEFISDWDTPTERPVGNLPISLFLGDANNDGFNDIVTANYGGNNISVLLWNNDISDWDQEIRKNTTSFPKSVAIGDVNNDGYNDIIATNSEDTVLSVFLWNLDENNLNGIHRLETRAYDEYGNYVCDGSEFLFYNS